MIEISGSPEREKPLKISCVSATRPRRQHPRPGIAHPQSGAIGVRMRLQAIPRNFFVKCLFPVSTALTDGRRPPLAPPLSCCGAARFVLALGPFVDYGAVWVVWSTPRTREGDAVDAASGLSARGGMVPGWSPFLGDRDALFQGPHVPERPAPPYRWSLELAPGATVLTDPGRARAWLDAGGGGFRPHATGPDHRHRATSTGPPTH